MSDSDQKFQHSKRLHQDQAAIDRQLEIARGYDMHRNTKWKMVAQPHRNHKMHILNCGNPRCVMCGNPRRWFKQRTQQEKRLMQDVDTVRNKHSNGQGTDESI
jgi:hypothetical protein